MRGPEGPSPPQVETGELMVDALKPFGVRAVARMLEARGDIYATVDADHFAALPRSYTPVSPVESPPGDGEMAF